MTLALQTFEIAYDEETLRLIRQRMRYGAAVFVLAYGAGWIFEYGSSPDRMGLYAVLFLLEALVCAAAAFTLGRARSRKAGIATALGAFMGISVLTTIYHVTAPGEIEVLTMALTFLLVGCMVPFPWGASAQAAAGVVGVLLCAFAVWQGVPEGTLPGLGPAALAFAAGLTVLRSHMVHEAIDYHLLAARSSSERHASRDALVHLHRALELQRDSGDAEREARILSQLAKTLPAVEGLTGADFASSFARAQLDRRQCRCPRGSHDARRSRRGDAGSGQRERCGKPGSRATRAIEHPRRSGGAGTRRAGDGRPVLPPGRLPCGARISRSRSRYR